LRAKLQTSHFLPGHFRSQRYNFTKVPTARKSGERSIYRFTFKDNTDAATIAAHHDKVCELTRNANAIRIVFDEAVRVDGLRYGCKGLL
jgi:hypothetical protein